MAAAVAMVVLALSIAALSGFLRPTGARDAWALCVAVVGAVPVVLFGAYQLLVVIPLTAPMQPPQVRAGRHHGRASVFLTVVAGARPNTAAFGPPPAKLMAGQGPVANSTRN